MEFATLYNDPYGTIQSPAAVTFKIINALWEHTNNGNDIHVSVMMTVPKGTLTELAFAGHLTGDQIPKDKIPNFRYVGGNWDVIPTVDTVVNGPAVFTWTATKDFGRITQRTAKDVTVVMAEEVKSGTLIAAGYDGNGKQTALGFSAGTVNPGETVKISGTGFDTAEIVKVFMLYNTYAPVYSGISSEQK